MDDASFRKFYPEEWEKQQLEKEIDTMSEQINVKDVLISRFTERMAVKKQEDERVEAQNDFDKLSNLKKDIVRRKIRKLIRRNQRVQSASKI